MYINSEEPTISFRRQDDLILIGGNDHKTGAKIDLSNAYKFLEDIAKKRVASKFQLHLDMDVHAFSIPHL